MHLTYIDIDWLVLFEYIGFIHESERNENALDINFILS